MKGGFRKRSPLTGVMAHTWEMRFVRNRLRNTRRSAGFTIVEVLIVLAVTGALFVSAAALISGRQNRTEFTIAINDIRSQIQQVVSDVSTGFYPTSADINCNLNAATNSPQFSSGTNQQGTNQDCIFMGKAVQFGVKNTDPEEFWTYSLAGIRQLANGNEVQNVSQADPQVMVVNTANPIGSTTSSQALKNGLTTGKMTYTNAGITKNIVAVAFLSDLSSNSNGLVTGAQNVNVVPIISSSGSTIPTTPASAVNSINANLRSAVVNPSGGVSICFVSSTTKQIGIVAIGGSNQRANSVTLTIKGTNVCP